MQRESIAERLRSTVPGLWRERRATLYRVLMLAIGVVAVGWSLRAVWHFTIDDAGISYAYAKHLAEGKGPVAVVGGPWVEGYSNPLWVFLLVPLHALGLDLPVAAQWLGALAFGLALAAGSAFICRVDGRRIRDFGAVELCFVLVSALCLELVVWVPAGLENALFGALLLGMLVFDVRESEDPALPPASGLLAFALSITRPEGVLYAAPLVLIQLIGAARSARAWPERMRKARATLLSFVLPLALYHLAHYFVFGHLLPNTYWAKPGGKTWQEGFDYLSRTLLDSGLAYAVPLALVGLYGKPRSKLLAAWSALAGVVFVLYSGGDWMPHGRFLSLFAPALLVLSALGLARVARLVVWLTRGRASREASALVLTAGLALAWWAHQRPRLSALRAERWCHFCQRVADTRSVQRLGALAALPSQSLLTHDFGGPSWLSSESFQPLDFLGLCDRSAALIRHRRAPGSVAFDHRLYQYFIHEQPTAPSWVLLPPNFWPLFDRSPEHLLDYYALPARLVPHARRDSFFALHRGELVDYFPPLEPTERRPLGEGLALIGAALEAESGAGNTPALGPGAPVRVRLALVPERELRGGERIAVRIEAGDQRVESELQRLDRGIDGVGRGLAPGEPLALQVALRLPAAAVASYRLAVGVAAGSARRQAPRAAGAPRFSDVSEVAADAILPAPTRQLPHYPSALPVALDAELRALRPEVTRVVEQSRSSGRAPADEALAERLMALGARLEASGDGAQAYLAYVWATQVRRRAWEQLADTVFRLRQLALGDEHAFEITLLRRYYAAGSAPELARLIAWYLSMGRTPEAEYFLRRWPASEPASEDALALRDALASELARVAADPAARGPLLERVAIAPLAGALDFESEGLDAWHGERAGFRAGPLSARQGLPGLRGLQGSGALSSREGGERARGALTSPEFVLDGRHLSLLVGGGSRRRQVGVELLVDGVVVASGAGHDSDSLFPIFWDVTAHAGKTARLRVFDQSARDHVLLDRVLLWK